jgi:hypothetical protein
MNDFLAKPVDPEALYAMLGKYLGAANRSAIIDQAMADKAPDAPDPEALIMGLAELARLLKTGNADASTTFTRLQKQLLAAAPDESAPLRRAMSAFDYETALPIVESILLRLT